MKRLIVGIVGASSLALASAAWLAPMPAEACGGFFCGRQPVDQTAERILFVMNDDGTTTMVVQIQYQGDAADFAWVLPLDEVPPVESLDTFPQAALTALDANSGPQFNYPDDPDCYGGLLFDAMAAGPPRAGTEEGPVTVHIRETVGPFDVAVIESEDPAELVSWLRTNEFRVTAAMEPYIGIYTSEGKKFLALRLQPGSDVTDIEPFQFDLPGGTPSIPLRMTALAAEPEMGITVFIVGEERYGPANWADVEVPEDEIVWDPYGWGPNQTNWTALVARKIDEVGGQGWVTEMAGSTEPYIDLISATTPSDPEQQEAQEALLNALQGHGYITRMYARLSAEEMISDPVFRRHAGGDVDRTRTLHRYVNGRDMCEYDWDNPTPVSVNPCDFTACGAGGLCRNVELDGALVAGCACAPGTTARTTFDPSGRVTVACQDQRLSFLNPGDRELPGEDPLPDPCVGFDCGTGSACVAMNMTPTCVCETGQVAVGALADDGSRTTSCYRPTEPVPPTFYDFRLPDRPLELPAGRLVEVPPPVALGGGACSATGAGAGGATVAWLGLIGIALIRRRRR